ncbi:MAG: hypothetical protein EBR90_01390 [Actinobacteria bacterium]|nr:hypothetical protein [Actinomycetota bacterium]
MVYSGAFKSTLPRANNSTNTSQIDALTTLRDYTAAALSATTNGTPIEYPFTAEESVKVIINQAAYSSYSAGSVSWTLSLEVSDAVAGTYKQVASIAPTVAAGAALNGQEVFLSGEQINKTVPNARFLRIVATKLSTAGNLTFGAYLVPSGC